tara:strand:+ start:2755 stop:3933 length:1179 start_codon:yes stop_codon:yes gene_type:complete
MVAKLGSVSSLLMKRIQMVDLEGQTASIRPQIDEAIARVLDSSRYIGGEEVMSFENELSTELDGAFVTSCANGTDALQIALMALGVETDDEIIVPAFTFISPVEVIALLGAKPVLVDVYPDTFNIDCEAVESAITDRTKAVIAVHLFGQCADMGKLCSIAKKHDIKLIEDTAQAISSIYCDEKNMSGKAGTIGDIGTTSFFPSKNLGCFGDGGAIITTSETLAQSCQTICNHGSEIRYSHSEVGVNSRLDSIQAAILRVKLKNLKDYNQARRQAAARYDSLLESIPGITVPHRNKRSSHVFHQYTIQIDPSITDNKSIKEELQLADIPSAIYYPAPIHEQKAYNLLDYKEGDFPVSEKLSKTVLSLPMHTELSAEQQEYIADRLKEAIKKWI